MYNIDKYPINQNPEIKISKLTKSFGEKTLFRHFDLNITGTGIYALCGESGKGKTTLLRIISGLDNDYTGEVSRYGKIAYCFQEHRLFPTLSAAENIYELLYDKPTDEDKARTRDFLLSLGFSDKDTELYPRELSGGMRQRVAFARAVLSDAEILIFDEPTKELDFTHRGIILDRIKMLSQERLIILVSHADEDLSALECTRIYI